MLDKFLVLLERFVVAHELIAANSGLTLCNKLESTGGEPMTVAYCGEACAGGRSAADDKELPVDGEDLIETPPKKAAAKTKAKAQPEPVGDDLDDEPAPARKAKAAPAKPDVSVLRDEIKTMAKHIAAGDSDQCADLFDELLEDYKVRTVTKIHEDDVADFHRDAKALVAKYYEIEG